MAVGASALFPNFGSTIDNKDLDVACCVDGESTAGEGASMTWRCSEMAVGASALFPNFGSTIDTKDLDVACCVDGESTAGEGVSMT
jgi:hypothetical protein